MIVFEPSQQPADKCQGMLSQLIGPRPIAMVSTVDEDGVVNVAPFSYYMPVTGQPMLLAITMGLRESDGGLKHSYENALRTGDLVVNVTTARFREHIETAAMEFPQGVSELDVVPWTTMPSLKVASPSLAEAPARMECVVHRVVDLGELGIGCSEVHVVFAEVICATLDESICTPDFRVDVAALAQIGRLGFPWFTQVDAASMFELERVPYAEFARQDAER